MQQHQECRVEMMMINDEYETEVYRNRRKRIMYGIYIGIRNVAHMHTHMIRYLVYSKLYTLIRMNIKNNTTACTNNTEHDCHWFAFFKNMLTLVYAAWTYEIQIRTEPKIILHFLRRFDYSYCCSIIQKINS